MACEGVTLRLVSLIFCFRADSGSCRAIQFLFAIPTPGWMELFFRQVMSMMIICGDVDFTEMWNKMYYAVKSLTMLQFICRYREPG